MTSTRSLAIDPRHQRRATPRRHVRLRRIAYVLAFVTWTATHAASAQAPVPGGLTTDVIRNVEERYPGIVEVLESHDSAALTNVVEVLSKHPSADVVTVLAWILEHRPAIDADRLAGLSLSRVIPAARVVPLDPMLRTLVNGNADQRRAAAVVIVQSLDLITGEDRARLERALVAALEDPSIEVRTWVAIALRRLETPTARTALAASLERPDVTAAYYGQIAGPRPREPRVTPPAFTPAVVEAMTRIEPEFRRILESDSDAEMRRLIERLAPVHDKAAAEVLETILEQEDPVAYGGLAARLLTSKQVRTGQVDIGRVARLLAVEEPERRRAAAEFFSRLFREQEPRVAGSARSAALEALTTALGDPSLEVRREAASALGGARARQATPALLRSLDLPDASKNYLDVAFGALGAIGDPRAVPVLEKWARAPREHEVRTRAAAAALSITKPADRSAALHRPLWGEAETTLEREVLAGGRPALPRAWDSLSAAVTAERQNALALLGWIRDARSIPVLRQAFSSTTGALSRQQILFDLDVILLTEGEAMRDGEDVKAIRSRHLSRVRELAEADPKPTIGIHAVARCADGITVLAETPDAFSRSRSDLKTGCGIVFHVPRVAAGAARVASTIYAKDWGSRIVTTIHTREGSEWVMLPAVPRGAASYASGERDLQPAFRRNYGIVDPLTIVRLDDALERVRRGEDAIEGFAHHTTIDPFGEMRGVYPALVPHLQRYRRDANLFVRYAAELAIARTTGTPDVRVLIAAIEGQPDGPVRKAAMTALSEYLRRQFDAHAQPASAQEREELVAATLSLKEAHRGSSLPQRSNIAAVRRWEGFALVDVAFGAPPRGGSGYAALFERRGDRWVFIYIPMSWIS